MLFSVSSWNHISFHNLTIPSKRILPVMHTADSLYARKLSGTADPRHAGADQQVRKLIPFCIIADQACRLERSCHAAQNPNHLCSRKKPHGKETVCIPVTDGSGKLIGIRPERPPGRPPERAALPNAFQNRPEPFFKGQKVVPVLGIPRFQPDGAPAGTNPWFLKRHPWKCRRS